MLSKRVPMEHLASDGIFSWRTRRGEFCPPPIVVQPRFLASRKVPGGRLRLAPGLLARGQRPRRGRLAALTGTTQASARSGFFQPRVPNQSCSEAQRAGCAWSGSSSARSSAS